MKKFLSLYLILLVLFMSACSSTYKNWQTVELKNCGTIKLPKEWSIAKIDNLYYIYDSNLKPVIIEWSDLDVNESRSDKYHSNYKIKDSITSSVYSNGAIYGSYYVEFGNENAELYFLSFPDKNESVVKFLVWDTELEYQIIKNIAQSFRENTENTGDGSVC